MQSVYSTVAADWTVVLYSYDQPYKHICMRNHNNDTIKTNDTVLRKIYLSLYLKGLCVRGSWRPNRTATYWTHSYGHQRFFPVLQGCSTGGPGTQLSAGCCFLYIIISPTLRSPNSLNFRCTELYNSSTSTQSLLITGHRNMHFRRLWNGIFDRHRAEIPVMQLTGHSLPVHQFLTVPWDFNTVPYCQPSLPTPMECTTSAVFWMACLAESEVNIQQ